LENAGIALKSRKQWPKEGVKRRNPELAESLKDSSGRIEAKEGPVWVGSTCNSRKPRRSKTKGQKGGQRGSLALGRRGFPIQWSLFKGKLTRTTKKEGLKKVEDGGDIELLLEGKERNNSKTSEREGQK